MKVYKDEFGYYIKCDCGHYQSVAEAVARGDEVFKCYECGEEMFIDG